MTERPVAALYLRSATPNAGAIVEQWHHCTEHATERGWSVDETFVDDGASGMCHDRQGLRALRAWVALGQVQVVLATEPGRIARDPGIIEHFGRFCDANGARLTYVDAPAGRSSTMERVFQEDARRRASGRDDGQNEEPLR